MDAVLRFAGVMIGIALAGGAAYLIIAMVNLLVRRLEGAGSSQADRLEAELADLRARLDDADSARSRIAELEERLDFAERMLAQQREVPRVGPGAERR